MLGKQVGKHPHGNGPAAIIFDWEQKEEDAQDGWQEESEKTLLVADDRLICFSCDWFHSKISGL